jgi:hypothetical protein
MFLCLEVIWWCGAERCCIYLFIVLRTPISWHQSDVTRTSAIVDVCPSVSVPEPKSFHHSLGSLRVAKLWGNRFRAFSYTLLTADLSRRLFVAILTWGQIEDTQDTPWRNLPPIWRRIAACAYSTIHSTVSHAWYLCGGVEKGKIPGSLNFRLDLEWLHEAHASCRKNHNLYKPHSTCRMNI